MKRSEILTRYYNEILSSMIDHYRTVLECDGRIEYAIYIWEDGEIEILERVQGDNSWLQARDAEPRVLFYAVTVSSPNFYAWGCTDEPRPDDEDAAEAMRQEIIDWIVDEYATNGAREELDAEIEDAEREEREEDLY